MVAQRVYQSNVMRLKITLCGASLLLLATLTACGAGTSVGPSALSANTPPAPSLVVPTPVPSAFVTRQGAVLMDGNAPFRFVGVNYYPLAGGPLASQCSMAADSNTFANHVRDTFAQLQAMQAKVVRLWAFQNYAGPQGNDFSDLDVVLQAAKEAHMHVVLTLENQWKDCTLPNDYRPADFYASGYKTPQGGYTLSYLDYTKKIVAHYKDDPTVLMWQLMNEAESADPASMQSFAAIMAGVIKGIDRNHLVSMGTLACGGQPGTDPNNYRALHSDPNIDVLELHDYGNPQEAQPSCWVDDMAVAQALGKPLFVGESGIDVTQGFSKDERASLLAAKMQANVSGGGVGYLIWSYGDADPTYGFSCSDGDPLCNTLKQASQTQY